MGPGDVRLYVVHYMGYKLQQLLEKMCRMRTHA